MKNKHQTPPDQETQIMPQLPHLYTLSEVSTMLRITQCSLRKRIARGSIVPLKVGKTLRFSPVQVNNLLKYGTTTRPQLAEAAVAGATN